MIEHRPRYFCADCLRYQEAMDQPCSQCDSIRVVLLSIVDQIVDPEAKKRMAADIAKANDARPVALRRAGDP